MCFLLLFCNLCVKFEILVLFCQNQKASVVFLGHTFCSSSVEIRPQVVARTVGPEVTFC